MKEGCGEVQETHLAVLRSPKAVSSHLQARRNVDLRERLWSASHRLVASLCEVRNWFWIPRHPQSHQWVSVCSVPVWSASSDHGRTFFRVPLSITCLPVVDCCSSMLGFVSPSRHLPLFCPTLPPEFVSFSRTEVGNP